MAHFAIAQNSSSKLPKIGDLQRVDKIKSAATSSKAPGDPVNSCFTCDFENAGHLPIEWKWDKNSATVYQCNKKLLRFGFNASHLLSQTTPLPTLNYRYNFIVSSKEDESVRYGEALTVLKPSNTSVCNGITLSPSNENASFIGTTSNQDLHIGTNDGTNQNITIVQQTGFVGINQQQPATDLDVNGTVHVANQVNVDGGVQVNQNAVINGNVTIGVGTQTPSEKLTVNGNIKLGSNLAFGNSTSNTLTINSNSGTWANDFDAIMPTTLSLSGFNFRTKIGSGAFTSRLFIKADGNVGVGTENPQAKLDVNGAMHVNGNVGIGTTNPQNKLGVAGDIGVSGDALISGNLGVGVATPAVKLEVSGNSRITGNLKLEGLSGTGSRMVVTDATGNLSAIAIPSSTGDNLGNHVATQALNLNANAISNSATLSFAGGGSLQPMGNNELRLNGRLDIGGANSITFEPFQVNGNSRLFGGIRCGNSFMSGNFGSSVGELAVQNNAYKSGGGVWLDNSDIRLKENIEPFRDGLSKLLKINTVSYNFKKGVVSNPKKRYIGIIAQEIEEDFPYMVQKRRNKFEGIKEDDYYTFDGSALTYVIINSIKALKLEIDSLKGELKKGKSYAKSAGFDEDKSIQQGLELSQNIPNPSDNSTRIDFKIPDGFNKAYLSVYDLNGQEIKRIEINRSGNGSETLYRKDFGTGVFIYTLYANGLVPVSKSLIFN